MIEQSNCCDQENGLDGGLKSIENNPPGLDQVRYRIGDYTSFLKRMLARISGLPSLPGEASLTSRDPSDLSIAFLDACAVVGDVLTFYDERMANEIFLRTAVERMSILELARAIGYELKPGLAASAYLAFELANVEPGQPLQQGMPALPKEIMLQPGIQVMSVPGDNEQPQTFETIAPARARPGWNALRPRRTFPQTVYQTDNSFSVQLEGTTLNIKRGDVILIAGHVDPGDTSKQMQFAKPASDPLNLVAFARPVIAIEIDETRKTTRLDLPGKLSSPVSPPAKPAKSLPKYSIKSQVSNQILGDLIVGKNYLGKDLSAYIAVQGWDKEVVQAQANTPKPPPGDDDLGIFILRARAGFYGNNAPRQEVLPTTNSTIKTIFKESWDESNLRTIWLNSQGTAWNTTPNSGDLTAHVYLERTLPEVIPGSWAVFDDAEGNGARHVPFRVAETKETSLSDYAMSAKVTGLSLTDPGGTGLTKASLRARYATAYLQSEKLNLAQTPITDPVPSAMPFELDHLELFLEEGQDVILSGTRTDLSGVTWHEALRIHEIAQADGFTELTLVDGAGNLAPQYSYLRDSVRLNANIALSSHGATVREVLGSGDARQTNQRFTLKRPPLTYISGSGGAVSTLQVRVNDVLWQEVPFLYGIGPDDQVYITRQDDAGLTTLTFGSRLPSGSNNVTAVYRSGIGASGAVKAASLTTLMTRPLGVNTVTNPLPAGGEAEPESRDSARKSAPGVVLTLDRVVSLQDYEDYARTFAGIGKAQAIAYRQDERSGVLLTVASTTGSPLIGTPVLENLRKGLDDRRDPAAILRIADYDPRPFFLTASLLIDPRYEFNLVLQNALQSLAHKYQFSQREPGQPVTAAETIACLNAIQGVTAVDLNTLDFSVLDVMDPGGEQPRQILPARSGTWVENQRKFLPAQLLTIDLLKVTIDQMTAGSASLGGGG